MSNYPQELGFIHTKLNAAIGWARKYSLFTYPFVTACCGMEYMATSCSHYDTDRFGAALPRFTPRQSDLLMVVGTVNHKLAPVLLRIYEQMAEPKWVVAFGACASSGGFYDNYTTVAGIDKIIPVDMYIPGCPPRPETVIDALMTLQRNINDSPQQLFQSDGGKQIHPVLPELLGDEIITDLPKVNSQK
ncbi:MAG TPA: NADH-quinone oxidoreductase subunit NuoB [Oligoflexia bacterium]|nr:NADH-quinone oxidoreductase subunit NuoB [Oligoflexia bacterium]HMP26819.1 NADH-quinone oxidoreductase subunit NuoB [Oligoflexia bacterium]